ncbi:MAG TPA: hypothetical protein VK802_03090 [Streptosporangiaceae bacterium]|nr:hypothetical protein [Streptosporangiaceae bacterium]
MAVKVYQDGIETQFDVYTKGVTVTVIDQHLYVSGPDTTVVAIYSPGSWHHARVADD